jgi:P4 family phage/plasmid primase-like protien
MFQKGQMLEVYRMSVSSSADIARMVELLHGSEEVLVELRVLAEKGTYSGYFDNVADLAAAAVRWSGRGNVYITLNRVHPDCAARRLNRTEWAKREGTTKDKEIVRRTGIYIDCDPHRLSGIASTDGEHEAALQLAREVRQWLGEQGLPEPLFISSGNGAGLFYKIDLPAEDGGLVKRLLEALAAKFDNAAVSIDKSVHNAARIVRLAGTLNSKGEDRPDRPHRLSRIVEAPEALAVVTGEQLQSVVDAAAGPQDKAHAADFAMEGLFDVGAWLTKHGVPFTVEPTEGGTRFRLGICPNKGAGQEDGRTWIMQFNDGGVAAGCFHAKCAGVKWPKLRSLIDPSFVDNAEREMVGGSLEKPSDCHRFGRIILDATKHEDGTNTFALEGDTLYHWRELSWAPMSSDEMNRELTRRCKAEADRLAKAARLRGLDTHAINVTSSFVGNVRNAMLSMVPQALGQPTWLAQQADWPANEMLACSDGLIHLPSFASGSEDYRVPLTPGFFSTLNLGYEFDPSGQRPERWLAFLAQLFPDDPNSILLLQEWMGYLLTLDTSHQKMLIMFGPGGGGKGTILDITRRLIGPANVASLTLPQLAESHSLQTLMGKSLCVFPDASIPDRMDKKPLVEMVKSITGEDLVSINPKHKPRFSAKLNTRLMVATNDMLDLPDPSGALSRRLLVLRFTKSFDEKPDTKLREKLAIELPGILLWSIEGWKRLHEQGRFTEPESGREVKGSLKENSSPVLRFVGERCVVDPNAVAGKDELYDEWKNWCAENDHDAGTKASFARLLLSAVPTAKSYKPRVEGVRMNCYKGIGLQAAAESDEWLETVPKPFASEEEARRYVEELLKGLGHSAN